MRTILLLAANPTGTHRLQLDREVKRIELILESSRDFQCKTRWKATDEDLRNALLKYQPEVVHFLGHGLGDVHRGDGTTRDLEAASDGRPDEGLAFEDAAGDLLSIKGDSLARFFALHAEYVRCVVLNACFSDRQAVAIAHRIDYVIGMRQAIGDNAAVKFSEGFYEAIAADRPYEVAFRHGRSAIDLAGIPEHLTPVLFSRKLARKSHPAEGAEPARRAEPPNAARTPPTQGKPARMHDQGAASHLRPADVERVAKQLARHIGPSAYLLASFHAARVKNPDDLVRVLSREIDSEENRRAFLAQLGGGNKGT